MTPIVAQFGGAEVVLELRRAAVDALRHDDPRATCRPRSPTSRPPRARVGHLTAALATLDELERTLAGGGAAELRIALHQNRGVVQRAPRPARRGGARPG